MEGVARYALWVNLMQKKKNGNSMFQWNEMAKRTESGKECFTPRMRMGWNFRSFSCASFLCVAAEEKLFAGGCFQHMYLYRNHVRL